MASSIRLLDCTLRDGGMAFEDDLKNRNPRRAFDVNLLSSTVNALAKTNIDIIEIGSIEITTDNKRDVSIYQNIEEISKLIPERRCKGQLFSALYRGPDTPAEDIPEWDSSKCEIVRLIVRYSQLTESMEFCKMLAKKGYKVFIQPAITSRYTDEEIQLLIDTANDIDAYALYFVDSYGYMMEKDVKYFFNLYNNGLKASVKIGFHAHNNMGLAFANTISLISNCADREIIVDSCIMGMGQGAGNLHTELITNYLNLYHNAGYNYNAVLDVCEIIDMYWQNNLWGYSVSELLSAINKTAYKYATSLRFDYNKSFSEIHYMLSNIPESMRHRYTPGDTEKLLEIFGHITDKNRG